MAEKAFFVSYGVDWTTLKIPIKFEETHWGVEVFEKRILCSEEMGVSVLENGKFVGHVKLIRYYF